VVVTTSSWAETEVKAQFSSCENLKEIITRIESDFAARGEVICEIRVNGMLLSEADEVKFAESQLWEIKDLSVRTQRPDLLIGEALTSALEILPQLEKSSLDTSSLLRGTDIALAKKRFSETLAGCQWLVDTLLHVRAAGDGVGRQFRHLDRWTGADQQLGQVIGEVSAAFSKSDLVLVADLLEYELTAALATWRDILQKEISEL
jgi:hypothetical protein